MAPLKALGRLANPLHLILVALTYFLGAGIARYLGSAVNARSLIVGLLVMLLFQVAMEWLVAVFTPLQGAARSAHDPAEAKQTGRAALYAAIAALATAAALAATLFQSGGASAAVAVCLGLSLLVIVVYAIPPMMAADRGFGALLSSAQIAYLVPSVGFLLQASDYHRLLNLCTLSLTLMLVATLIALELPDYAENIRLGRTTILTRMGWERALTLHHLLLAMAYMLLGILVLLGFSFSLIGPAFLTLPFAVLQAYLLQAIVRGARPIWGLLRANTLAVFILTTYFLTLSFWLR